MDPLLTPVHLKMVFARTSLGAAEAVSVQSALDKQLRYLLILIDGQSALEDLRARFGDAEDVTEAASALWQANYIRFVRETGAAQASNAAQSAGLWDKLTDTLSRTQPVVPLSQLPEGVRFSESGKFWFSQGGRQLSEELAQKAAEAQAAGAALPAGADAASDGAERAQPRKPLNS